jgi:hypothetical protein
MTNAEKPCQKEKQEIEGLLHRQVGKETNSEWYKIFPAYNICAIIRPQT